MIQYKYVLINKQINYLICKIVEHKLGYGSIYLSMCQNQNAREGESEDRGWPEPAGHGSVIRHNRRFRRD